MNDVTGIETIRNLVDKIGKARLANGQLALDTPDLKLLNEIGRAYAKARGIQEGIKTHVLKTDQEPFAATWAERKLYEYRFDDRGYQVGDLLNLRETNPNYEGDDEYSGRRIQAEVMHILRGSYGLPTGWVIMGISIVYKEHDAK